MKITLAGTGKPLEMEVFKRFMDSHPVVNPEEEALLLLRWMYENLPVPTWDAFWDLQDMDSWKVKIPKASK